MGYYMEMMDSNFEIKKENFENALKLKVVGIIRPNEEAVSQASSGMIYYSKDLTEYIINKNNESQIVKEQKENPEINVLTKMSFNDNNKFANKIIDITNK